MDEFAAAVPSIFDFSNPQPFNGTMREWLRRMQEAGFTMIDKVSKQMDSNPALTQNMDPQQRQQMKQMLGAVNQMRDQLKEAIAIAQQAAGG